jgi:tetratricopeptide (TPR) repeat protein
MAARRFRLVLLLAVLTALGGVFWATRRPSPASEQLALGKRLAAAGKKIEAFDAFAAAADATPDDESVWTAATEAAEAAHGLVAADALAVNFLDRHPESKALRSVRGGLYEKAGLSLLEQGRAADGFAALRTAVRIAPSRALAQRTLGELLFENGFHRRAAAHFEAAVSTNPSDARAWHDLGRLRSAADIPAAIAAFETAVHLAPDNALARLDLAAILRTGNRLGDSETRYREALKIAPEDPVILTQVGGFLATTGADPKRRTEAEYLLEKATRLDPRAGDAYAFLGKLAFERGDRIKARTLLEKALVCPLDDAQSVWYTLSRACFATGDTLRGREALNRGTVLREERFALARAVELAFEDPTNPEKRIAVARLYARQEDYVKAISQYRGALILAPDKTLARHELDQLTARLTREGKMPSMALYEAMVATDKEKS